MAANVSRSSTPSDQAPAAPSTNGQTPRATAPPARASALSYAQREHQVKTALAVIHGFSATLDAHWDSLSEADRRKGLAAIGRRTLELMEQTERLLEDARRDVAGRSRSVVHIDVTPLVREAAGTWNAVSDTPVVAIGDPSWVSRPDVVYLPPAEER